MSMRTWSRGLAWMVGAFYGNGIPPALVWQETLVDSKCWKSACHNKAVHLPDQVSCRPVVSALVRLVGIKPRRGDSMRMPPRAAWSSSDKPSTSCRFGNHPSSASSHPFNGSDQTYSVVLTAVAKVQWQILQLHGVLDIDLLKVRLLQ